MFLQDVKVVADQEAVLRCQTFGAPVPTVTWIRGGQVKINVPNQRERESERSGRQLQTDKQVDRQKKTVNSLISALFPFSFVLRESWTASLLLPKLT